MSLIYIQVEIRYRFEISLVLQAWKLKDEERLLDVIDPDLTDCPTDEVMRFIIVALFCTQAVSNQRPSMKQVVEMLTRKVNLNVRLLTEPGICMPHLSSSCTKGGTSTETTKSRPYNGKQSINPFVASSPQASNSYSISQMLPR